ncbi:MAG: formyltransferase family protein [Dehalococcoidia bacterium]|nr:formyltransferase family protein [Dehalococcoidia bacterium]
MLKIGWFSTARGDSSKKLLDTVVSTIRNGGLDARIEFVFCSREAGESEKTDIFLSQVKQYSIPLVTSSVKKFAGSVRQQVGVKEEELPGWRLEYDRQVIARLDDFKVDICLLAGYMLIVGREMCSKFNMINLHPALPTGPKGTWQEVIWQLISERATESGVMIHLVTPELDRGPVISFCRYPIRGGSFDALWNSLGERSVEEVRKSEGADNALFNMIRQSGFIRETPLIIHTLSSFSQGKISIDSRKKLLDSHGQPISGYELTAEIDREISL